MTRALILALFLTGCAPQTILGGMMLYRAVQPKRIVNPDCPAHLTIQDGAMAGFCDRRKVK